MKETDTLIILLTLAILTLSIIMFVIYSFFIKKKSQLLLRQQEAALEFQKQLSLSEIEIKEQTLNYIGQELHDDLGQKLSVVRMMTNRKMANEEDTIYVQEMNEIIGECIQDIRDLSKTFISDSILHFGLIESLQKEVNRLQKHNLIDVQYNKNFDVLDINKQHSLILFRIIQESINNVLKHANATKLYIQLEDSENVFLINIKDNGKGIDPKIVESGSGMKNMRNRAKLINADYNLESKENQGTCIAINYKKTK